MQVHRFLRPGPHQNLAWKAPLIVVSPPCMKGYSQADASSGTSHLRERLAERREGEGHGPATPRDRERCRRSPPPRATPGLRPRRDGGGRGASRRDAPSDQSSLAPRGAGEDERAQPSRRPACQPREELWSDAAASSRRTTSSRALPPLRALFLRCSASVMRLSQLVCVMVLSGSRMV